MIKKQLSYYQKLELNITLAKKCVFHGCPNVLKPTLNNPNFRLNEKHNSTRGDVVLQVVPDRQILYHWNLQQKITPKVTNERRDQVNKEKYNSHERK